MLDGEPVGGPPTPEVSSSPRPARRRLRALLAGVGLLVAVAAIVATLNVAHQPDQRLGGPGVGRAAPRLHLPNLIQGAPDVDLAHLRGMPVVVNFWASWCVPCRQEMPALESVNEQVGDRVAFLGVDHQDGRVLALQFLKETGVRYPSGYDPDGAVAPTFGAPGLPTTIFVDSGGRIVGRHVGPFTAAGLRAAINELFALK